MEQKGIKSVHVEKLFGHYNYDLPSKDDYNKDLSKLFILYGENGAGKTTVLNIIFFLISTKDKSGYKSKLAQTKFKRVAIQLMDGTEIGAFREDSLYGSYTYYIKKNRKYIKKVLLSTYDGHHIRFETGTKIDTEFKDLLEYIKKLDISIYFLSEDRKTLNSQSSTDYDIEHDFPLSHSDIELARKYELNRRKRNLIESRLSLSLTEERFIDWVRKQVIQSSKTGETNSIHIYSELIKNVNKPKEKLPPLSELMKEIKELEERGKRLSQMGLIDPLNFSELKESIKNSKKDNEENLPSIVQLFINSTKARLDALQNLYETLNDFVNAINDFYTNKTINFNLGEGFSIVHSSGEIIDLEILSSGEKQLLLLFMNTITATDQATIFIIDEPEISLNIKWQRKLLETLLRFSSKNFVQFIIATHSIELLTPNSNNVVKLEEL